MVLALTDFLTSDMTVDRPRPSTSAFQAAAPLGPFGFFFFLPTVLYREVDQVAGLNRACAADCSGLIVVISLDVLGRL